jgi:hypothetical protein
MRPKIKTPFPTLAPKGKITKKESTCGVEKIPKTKQNKTKQKDENEGKCVW